MKQDVYNYSLRFVLMPNVNVEKRIKELVEFCRNTQINDVIFFIAPEDFHVGHITKEMAIPYVEAILKAKKELDKLGITTSLNPWCTLVHGDRGRKLQKGQNFRRMVFAEGTMGETVVCPRSKEWQDYYVDYMSFLIKKIQPYTIWIEDDFRLHCHSGDGTNGCFCTECLKRYAKALGVKEITREEMFNGLINNDKKIKQAYASVSKESMENVLHQIIDKVGNLGTKFSLMTGFGPGYHLEGRDFREMFKILSTYNSTENRLGLGSYRQTSSHGQGYLFSRAIMQSRAFLPDDLVVYSEIENAPMSRYCKSANWTAFEMITTCPLLLDGATFDIFEFNGNGVTDSKLFSKSLNYVRPFLQKVKDLGLRYSSLSGIDVAILKNRYLGYDKVNNIDQINDTDNYMGAVLSMLGGSVRYEEDPFKGDIVALLPTTAKVLEVEQLKEILTNKFVIMQAETVEVLLEKGLGDLLSITNSKKIIERTGVYTYEQVDKAGIFDDDEFRASCQLFVGNYLKLDFKENSAEVLTKMYSYDYSFAGNGISIVNGNILIFPYYDSRDRYFNDIPFGLFHKLRADVINYAVTKIDKKNQTFFVKECMVIPYLYKGEEKDHAILVNYIEDEVENLVFTTKEKYSKICVATVDNPNFREIDFERNNFDYKLKFTMQPQTAIILELTK